MTSESVYSWTRRGKSCSLTQKELGSLSFHYSAFIETEQGMKRLDFHPDIFQQWKQSLDPSCVLVAWWKVQPTIKKVSRKESSQDFTDSFGFFYEQYAQADPQLVLRLAHFLCKMKLLHVDQADSGQWSIILKEEGRDVGYWVLPFCQLEKNLKKQIEDCKLIRSFFNAKLD